MTVRMAMAREILASQPEGANAILRAFGARRAAGARRAPRARPRGLYPPVLVDHGLPEALRSAARHSPVPVDTTIAPVGRLEPLTEAAVYFCCAEALQNAREARRRRPADLPAAAARRRGAVVFEVRDDGRGFVRRARSATGRG